MSENKENQKLYAFWKYDLPPYILGGKIKKMCSHGKIEAEEYGSGMQFTPIKILNENDGKILLDKLEVLKKEHSDSEKLFKRSFQIKYDNLFVEYGIKI